LDPTDLLPKIGTWKKNLDNKEPSCTSLQLNFIYNLRFPKNQ